jgi:hypothetical protein
LLYDRGERKPLRTWDLGWMQLPGVLRTNVEDDHRLTAIEAEVQFVGSHA